MATKREYLYQYEDSEKVLLGTRRQIEQKTEYSYNYISALIHATKANGQYANKTCRRTADYNKIYYIKHFGDEAVKKLTHKQLEKISNVKKIPRHPTTMQSSNIEILAIKDTPLVVFYKEGAKNEVIQ